MLGLREDVRSGPPSGPGDPRQAPDPAQRTEPERSVRCAICDATVTSTRQRISVQGSHQHRFMNPGGFLFHVACFAEAIGCRIQGPPSDEYPWFPGMSWRLALCAGCGTHLGWHFRAGQTPGFFGLIIDRLRTED
jgi:hypothetical protein